MSQILQHEKNDVSLYCIILIIDTARSVTTNHDSAAVLLVRTAPPGAVCVNRSVSGAIWCVSAEQGQGQGPGEGGH